MESIQDSIEGPFFYMIVWCLPQPFSIYIIYIYIYHPLHPTIEDEPDIQMSSRFFSVAVIWASSHFPCFETMRVRRMIVELKN